MLTKTTTIFSYNKNSETLTKQLEKYNLSFQQAFIESLENDRMALNILMDGGNVMTSENYNQAIQNLDRILIEYLEKENKTQNSSLPNSPLLEINPNGIFEKHIYSFFPFAPNKIPNENSNIKTIEDINLYFLMTETSSNISFTFYYNEYFDLVLELNEKQSTEIVNQFPNLNQIPLMNLFSDTFEKKIEENPKINLYFSPISGIRISQGEDSPRFITYSEK